MQTDRQANKWVDRQAGRQASGRGINRLSDIHTDWASRQENKQTDRQTGGQADNETCSRREKHIKGHAVTQMIQMIDSAVTENVINIPWLHFRLFIAHVVDCQVRLYKNMIARHTGTSRKRPPHC